MIHLDSDLFYDICNPTKLIQSKIESLTFINVSNPTLTSFLVRSESKSSFITSSALSWIVISMLPLLKCVACSSSESL